MTTTANQLITPAYRSTSQIERAAQSIFVSTEFQKILAPFVTDDDLYTGGYLCILSTTEESVDNPSRRTALIGTVDPRKTMAYISLANEKALRIHRTDQLKSSFLTRNVVLKEYGGGIRTPKWILAFSGLPELVDEAFVLWIAHTCKLAPLPYLYNEIAIPSGSHVLFQALLTPEDIECLSH